MTMDTYRHTHPRDDTFWNKLTHHRASGIRFIAETITVVEEEIIHGTQDRAMEKPFLAYL